MKVQGLTIVDSVGATVLELDGSFPTGQRTVGSRMPHDEAMFNWPLLVGSLNSFVWMCTRGVWQLSAFSTAITVSGGSGATVMPVHCASGVALASGTDQLSAAVDVQETGPATFSGLIIAAPTKFRPGDALGLVFAGTLTGLVGVASFAMKRVA